jgi:hypothetical protein
MFRYLFFPTSIGGAFRRLSMLMLLLSAICARNMWLLSGEPTEPTGLPYVSPYADILALSYTTANWPYIIGFFIVSVLAGLAARYVDMAEFGNDEPEAITERPTIH